MSLLDSSFEDPQQFAGPESSRPIQRCAEPGALSTGTKLSRPFELISTRAPNRGFRRSEYAETRQRHLVRSHKLEVADAKRNDFRGSQYGIRRVNVGEIRESQSVVLVTSDDPHGRSTNRRRCLICTGLNWWISGIQLYMHEKMPGNCPANG